MMGERRTTCSSLGNRSTEHHERNGRRHEAHERPRFLLCVLCISIALLIPLCSSAAGTNLCLPHCWKSETSVDVQFKDGDFMEKIVDEKECKDWCFSNETCIGVYWGFSPALKKIGCWLQMSSKATSESLTNATHWSLSDCSDDCLPYCWKEKWTHVQVAGGVLQSDVDTENECKVSCADDQGCNGADYNTSGKACYLLFMSPMEHIADPDPIHHWEIQRNLSATCQQESKAAVPEGSGTVLSTTETAEAADAAETAKPAENPVNPENAENPVKAENTENAPNAAVFSETAANETEASTDVNAETTTLDFDVIVFGTTIPGANDTRVPVGAAVVGKKKRPHPRGRGRFGYSHAKKGPASRMDVDCECPDYMIGIIGLGATMAVLVLIIIALLAFITYQIHEQEAAEAEENPRGGRPIWNETPSLAAPASASASAASISRG